MFNKGALSLLTNYGSDTSDDEVPGPRVSTKRTHKSDDEEPSEEPFLKKLERLPLPSILFNKTNLDEHIDNPDFHDGRIRSFPHERGNWATYVFIPFEVHDGIKELISTIIKNVPRELNLQKVDDLHISLTKTVILKHHWIESFIQGIKTKTSHVKRFMILFGTLKVYCNEERTRTFIGLQIRTGYDSLMKLVEALDSCLVEFSLPTFYKNPSFHMSIAWCLGDFEKELNLVLPQLNHRLSELIDDFGSDHWYIYVNSIFCKTGNKYYNFVL